VFKYVPLGPADNQRAAPVRTKYDRMFERRNQSILTPHYSALVTHDDDEEEVFTLARKDHALEGEGGDLVDGDLVPLTPGAPLISSEDLSKRKLKAGASKKQSLRNKPTGEKLVFDDEGLATDFYKSGRQEEELGGGEAARREFQEREREKMREVSKVDREVARAAKMEKKRKRKDKEREVSPTMRVRFGQANEQARGLDVENSDEDGPVAILAGPDDDEFSEEESFVPPPREDRGKRQRVESNVEDEEALALKLLQG